MAGQIARILVNFLEVAITSIVFHKGVYPSGAFERRRYMNLVVQKAKHPEVENYIHSAVNGLFPLLEKVSGNWIKLPNRHPLFTSLKASEQFILGVNVTRYYLPKGEGC
ncbi:unnamed protein product [Amaranthus hypochondriacus]